MITSVVFALIVVGIVRLEVGGRSVNTTVTAHVSTPCPFPLALEGEACVLRKEVMVAIESARMKRQVVGADCPRCVAGIFDLYPEWDDCSKINYCLDGHLIPLDCRHFNATYFNPVSKACEVSAQPNNVCIFRSFTALLG